MHRCCVLGCPTKADEKIPYFLFPSAENLDLRQEWIKAVGKVNWEPALTSKVCSNHFKEDDFYIKKTHKKLKSVAVPSINVGLCDTLKLAKMTSKECVVPTCTPQVSKGPYFHFPKDKTLCLKWLLAIPKGGWSLNQDSQVCSRHFDNADIVVHDVQAWLKTGSVPKLYLDSATDQGTINLLNPFRTDDPAVQQALSTPGSSKKPDASKPSTSQDVDLVEEGNGIYKIKLDDDCGSESDLEIIEPEIETFEVSDTSDEDQPPPKTTSICKELLQTSLKLQVNEVRSSNLPKSVPGVPVKPLLASNGKVIRGDSKIKCCVPRCGSVAGNPVGVGFHSFPQVGETRLSVRSLDNKLTVHDLFSMWKSLLSVPVITKDSYVCTRHFTPNDYTGNFLNKVAVPTQFLPTPVTFAPCKVQNKTPVQPPPLVLLNKSKNPPPILRKSVKSNFTTYSTPPIRFPGIPSINNVTSLARQPTFRLQGPKKQLPVVKQTPNSAQPTQPSQPTLPTQPSKPTQPTKPTLTTKPPQSRLQIIAPKPPFPLMRLAPQLPIPKKPKLGCSINDCPNRQQDENNKAVLYRLPHNIEKCKEWVYSCGHPEWLDKGMVIARSVFRICSLHFASEMFLDKDHKVLKGSAKPTVNVQEPYKKCIVKHCHNYFDKDRLHYIGVDFATFPKETLLFNSWVKAVKNNTGCSSKSVEVTDEDVNNFKGAVICSLHFRNSDYISRPGGKSLCPKAIPTMNLVYVKDEEDVPTPSNKNSSIPSGVAKDQPENAAPSSEINDGESERKYSPKKRRPPYLGRRRRRGRRPGWMKSVPAAEGEQNETNEGGEKTDPANVGDKSAMEDVPESEPKAVEETSPPKPPVRRGRPSRKSKAESAAKPDTPVQDGVDEESGVDEGQSSRRSSRTLFSRRGRPLRSAVLKRKKLVDSGSESEDSAEEPLPRKRGRPRRQNSDEESSDVGVRRSLRPRRAAATKKIVMDDSESEQDYKDEDWQDEYENNEPINYGGGVAEGGHFLDPVLGVEPLLEEFPENASAPTAAQESIELSVGEQQKEDVTMSSDIEDRHNEVMEESTNEISNSVTGVEKENENDGMENMFDVPVTTPAHDAVKEAETDSVVRTLDTTITSPPADEAKENENNDLEGAKNDRCVTDCTSDAVKETETGGVVRTLDSIPVTSTTSDAGKESNAEGVEGTQVDTSVPCNYVKESETNDETHELAKKDTTLVNEMEESSNLETNNENDPSNEVSCFKSTQQLSDSQASQPKANDGTKTHSEAKENVIPYGPKLPIVTRADVEFFRSILPTMASFNHLQKTEFKATIITTLKELLNEDLDLEVSPKTKESDKDDSQMPIPEAIVTT